MEKSSERTSVTVSIKDLFLFLCSRWRVLIIWLVIGAVLGGAYSAYKSLKTDTLVSKKEAAMSIYENMSDADKANLNNFTTAFINYLNQFEYYSDYYAKSIFMQLNPDTAKTGVLTYYIETDNESIFNEELINIYKANITNDNFAKLVADEFGISVEEAFYYYDGIVVTENSSDTTDANTFNQSMIIKVYGEDEEFITEMMNLVKESVDDLYKSLTGKTREYKLVLFNETITKDSGTYIYDRQTTYTVNMKKVLSDCTALRDWLGDDMLTAVEYSVIEQYEGDYIDIAFPGASAEETIVANRTINISKKWVLVGAAGFFILAILVIIIKYLVKGVVRCYDDIEYTYGIQVLGTYDDPKTAGREHKTRLDRWLKSLRIKRKSQDRDSSAALIAKKLQLLAKNHGLQNICVAIGPDADTDETFMEDVVTRAEGINVTVASNIVRNAEAINKVLEADGVVLLEQMDKSRFSSIDEERVMCAGNNIRILGVIVAE